MYRPHAAIILSPHNLLRELIADWLGIRFGSRIVAATALLDDCLMPQLGADLLIWDARDYGSASIEAAQARFAAEVPSMRIVIIRDPESTLAGALASAGIATPATVPIEQLTPLETEVLLAVASGYRNAEIARHMRRSSKTVEKHRANLQRKLGLRTVAQLTAYALRVGVLDIDTILHRR